MSLEGGDGGKTSNVSRQVIPRLWSCHRKGSRSEGVWMRGVSKSPFWAERRWDLLVSCDTDTTMSIKYCDPCVSLHNPMHQGT